MDMSLSHSHCKTSQNWMLWGLCQPKKHILCMHWWRMLGHLPVSVNHKIDPMCISPKWIIEGDTNKVQWKAS
jgi:hypothetical protein